MKFSRITHLAGTRRSSATRSFHELFVACVYTEAGVEPKLSDVLTLFGKTLVMEVYGNDEAADVGLVDDEPLPESF